MGLSNFRTVPKIDSQRDMERRLADFREQRRLRQEKEKMEKLNSKPPFILCATSHKCFRRTNQPTPPKPSFYSANTSRSRSQLFTPARLPIVMNLRKQLTSTSYPLIDMKNRTKWIMAPPKPLHFKVECEESGFVDHSMANDLDEQLEQTSLPALNNRLDSCVFHRLSFDEESLDHSEDISQRSIVDSYEMGTMELTVPKIVVSGFDDNNNNERSTASELFAESLGIMEVSFIDESSTDRELEDSDDSDLKELRQDLKFSQPSRRIRRQSVVDQLHQSGAKVLFGKRRRRSIFFSLSEVKMWRETKKSCITPYSSVSDCC